MRKFCEFLRACAMKIIQLMNKINLLTKEQQESYESVKIRHEKFEDKYLKDKKYCKVTDHCHYAGNVEVLRIAYAI